LAHLIPEALPATADMSERLVFESFSQLGETWTVMWDVPVGQFGRPKAGLRQIDFLLLNEYLGVLIVEVKGGAVKAEAGEWFTQPRGSTQWKKLQQSPFKQAADQRYTLQRYLTDHLHIDRRSFAHAVALPATKVDGPLGPDAPRELILDVTDLRNPAASLRRVRDHWGECPTLSAGTVEATVARLRPSFIMTVVAAASAAEAAAGIERETRRQTEMVESQVRAYKALLSSDRVVVLGGAGTGKTVIAAKLARQLSSTGSRTLLLCHRAGVHAFLSNLLGQRSPQRVFDGDSDQALHVSAWSRLVNGVAARLGGSSMGAASSNLADWLLEYRESLAEPFDALVIDEGQEFTHDQIEALSWLLKDPDRSPLYIFADPFQHSGIFTTSTTDRRNKNVTYQWMPPIGASPVMLTTNCRNSSQIAEVAARFYPDTTPTPIVDGPAPTFHTVEGTRVLAETFQLVKRLLGRDGFQANQLLVVPIDAERHDVEQAAKKAGVSVVAIDQVHRFPLTPKDLRVAWGNADDVQGLEADVAIVAYRHRQNADVDELMRWLPREIYIATSRGRTTLHFVTDLEETDVLAMGAKHASAQEDRASEIEKAATDGGH
jgi:hypothetical protein